VKTGVMIQDVTTRFPHSGENVRHLAPLGRYPCIRARRAVGLKFDIHGGLGDKGSSGVWMTFSLQVYASLYCTIPTSG
jgi:hypothetical protein